MMRNILVASAATIAISAGTALAADPTEETYTPVFLWSGPYVGVQAGYVVGGDAYFAYEGGSPTYDYDLTPTGFYGGIHAGWNHQYDNNLVLGIEGDVNWANITASGDPLNDPTYDSRTVLDWTGAARLRVGWAMDRFLPYIAGGIAGATFRFQENDTAGFYSSGNGVLVGWTLGVGAEYALNDRWTIRGEYRYTDYLSRLFTATAPGISEEWDAEIRTHGIQFGASLRW
jgi:outer membrane immunogenic protein